jgi:hypothetical protein
VSCGEHRAGKGDGNIIKTVFHRVLRVVIKEKTFKQKSEGDEEMSHEDI